MNADASGLQPSLPSDSYRTPESFAADRRTILARDWFCAGRGEQVREPGDHLLVDVAGESVLVVRDRNGALHAHYNVCRHRGARLCDPDSDARWGLGFDAGAVGRALIRCPYHGWAYGLDGHLVATPGIDGIDKTMFGLHPVGVGEWGGFLFLNLSPLLAFDIGAPAQRLGNYPLADLITARTLSYEVHANWKLILENYNECYHCAGVHPELCEIVPEFRRDGGIHLDWETGIPHRDGAVTFTRSGKTSRASLPGLSAEEQVRHKGELIYPNLMLSVSMDHAAAFLLWPLAYDRTRIECRFLFHPEEMQRADFDPSDAVDFWDLVNRQDWAMCERVQAGISSRVHDRGYYSPMEDYSLDIRRYVDGRQIAADGG